MGFYEAAKDALTLAQKADNIELVQKLMDVQSAALDMQHQLQIKDEEIFKLRQDIKKLQDRKKYVYEEGHKWLIDVKRPDIKFCPTCMNRDDFESPLGTPSHNNHRYCGNCKNSIN